MDFSYSTQRIFEIIGGSAEISGAYDGEITGISSLTEAVSGDLSFLSNSKYTSELEGCKASVVLLPRHYKGVPKDGQLFIRTDKPSFALALICRDIEGLVSPRAEPGIHPSAVVHPEAVVSPLATVGPLCVIAEGAKIGAAVLESQVTVGRYAKIEADAYLYPQVVISDFCEVYERCRISAGAVIGSDGYGYEFHEGAHQRVPQIGRVVLEADVDVGANSAIDCARFGATIIGQGTKIDNLVQIGHNVRTGKHCLLVSQVGISGSTELGDGVVLGGKAGLVGHIKVGSGTMLGGLSGLTHSVPPNSNLRGFPARPSLEHGRIIALQRKLPDLFKRFAQLEKTVESLRS